jgi:hypothetical protein
LADSFVIRMEWIYRREYASNSLVNHDDTTWFSVTNKWHMEIIKAAVTAACSYWTFYYLRHARDTGLPTTRLQQFTYLKYRNKTF